MEIMNTLITSLYRNSLLASGILLGITSASASDVVLQKAPPLTVEQAPAYPENLARFHLGAEIQSLPQSVSMAKLQLSSKTEDNNTAEAALLCDDPTTGYKLANGASTILVSLPSIENVQSVSFLNDGASGDVSIATSNAKLPADSPQWHAAEKQALGTGAFTAKVGPSEAKYVKVSFNVTKPGRIAAFGVYATPAVSDFTMPRPRKVSFEESGESFALINYNFTDLHAKARALYVSSGADLKQANNMIDDQPATAYAFASDDAAPTAVIDLGKICTLRRLSSVFSPRAGSVEFYVLNNLPMTQTGDVAELSDPGVQTVANAGTTPGQAAAQPATLPKSLKIGAATFSRMKSVGSVVSRGVEGRASVDFPATSGRYIMVKWNGATPGTAFSVAEVAAFGSSKQAGAVAASDGKRTMGGKEVADGKNILDNKDIPAEAPEAAPQAPGEGPTGQPPGLPNPPPFTFIPEVPPASP
jgi:hypothetical protein